MPFPECGARRGALGRGSLLRRRERLQEFEFGHTTAVAARYSPRMIRIKRNVSLKYYKALLATSLMRRHARLDERRRNFNTNYTNQFAPKFV